MTGDAERILRQQRADLLAMRMLVGGQMQGGAAAAPEPPTPSAASIGAAEAERQKKQLEDINKALADQQRILAAGLPDRIRVKAEIEAEAYIREHALTGLAAEEYRRKAVTLALATEADARGQELAGMAGAAIGSIIPGIGTLIGGLIGGAAGGGLGGLIGPGPKHHGWSWTLGADDSGMMGFKTANDDPVAQQQFAAEQQQIAAFNTWMQQSGMKAAGAYIVGGNNDPNLEHDYASFAAGFSNLRFTAANDNRLNTALSGRTFTDPNQLADLTTFLTQTMAILEKAPLNDFATALKGVNDTYDAAIKKAKDYALAEGDLTAERDRRIADVTARRDLQASSLTAGLQVRYLRATGATEQADLLAFDTAAAQERQQMTNQILAIGLASTQYAADRMVNIEKTLAAERLAIQEKYAADSKRASQSLLTELTIGNQSALAPEQRNFAGLSLLNDARHSLDAGGALSDFTTVAQQVLPVARDFLGTSERYAALVAEVAGAVASKGGDPAGLSTLLQAQVDGTDALRDVFARYGDQQLTVASATLSELRRLASVLEALMARSFAA